MRRGLALIAVAITAGLSVAGCDVFTSVGPKSCNSSPDANEPAPTYTDGTVKNGIYMSSPWDQKLLYFPGGMLIRVEHHLGTVPRVWNAYLSFAETGIRGSSVAPAAGNQVELVNIDDLAITVKNGTCSDYWLLITAEADAPPGPPT